MQVVTPTSGVDVPVDLFLAGTIDMGNSVDWQSEVIKYLEDLDITIANPRRGSFDDFSKEELHRQINWELDHLEKAVGVFLYLAPGSVSPISLLELGLLLGKNKNLVVCCPDGYQRKDNVVLTTLHRWSESDACYLTEDMESALRLLRDLLG